MKKIDQIFRADQADRKNPDFFTKKKFFDDRDKERKKQTKGLIKNNELKTGKDWYQAAMIFHHSNKLTDLNLALKLIKKSLNKKNEKAKWLFAAITDRILMKENKLQKFGTQFFRKNDDSPWVLYKVNPKTTDQERGEFNVPAIKQMKSFIEKLNQKNQ